MKSYKLALVVCLFAASAFPAAQVAKAEESRGAVFVMTNAADGNHIDSYARSEDGSLQWAGSVATGGNGSGGKIDPLHSQGSLRLSEDHGLLFAVNAASGTISSFHVDGAHLALADTVNSGGALPSALSQTGNLLYVLNSGGNGNVTGFRVNASGHMQPIPHSMRSLREIRPLLPRSNSAPTDSSSRLWRTRQVRLTCSESFPTAHCRIRLSIRLQSLHPLLRSLLRTVR